MKQFDTDGYVYISNVLNEQDKENIVKNMFRYQAEKFFLPDQCALSIGFFNICPDILLEKMSMFEAICEKKLSPTYSYGRIYKKGEILPKHIDRGSCEISATLTVKCYGSVWPIFMGNNKVNIKEGDAVLYKGNKIEHGREKYLEGEQQLQVFLHYITNDGPFKEYAYEYKRRWKDYCRNVEKYQRRIQNGSGN